MNGQWLGKYSGTNTGELVIDIDDRGEYFEGYAYAYPDDSKLPHTYAHIKTPNKNSSVDIDVFLFPIDPLNGAATDWEKIAHRFPGIVHSKSAKVKIQHDGKSLDIQWTTDIGTKGNASIPKSRAAEPTDYLPLTDVQNWKKFKEFVGELDRRRFIFRGQKEVRRLRTGFHRTGRADLHAFLSNDIQTLYRHLSLRTRHLFDLEVPEQNGAFFNLVQHHGYPTPLLDWTYSPFVSAFFAYRNVTNADAKKASVNDKVRIFIFNQKDWCSRYPQMKSLIGKPHFSIMEFIAIENERMVPQQSISSVTNIDDIETYIRSLEKTPGEFLRFIDLPMSERPLVMNDLAVMGITAGSLFPSLDGACEELREQFFSI